MASHWVWKQEQKFTSSTNVPAFVKNYWSQLFITIWWRFWKQKVRDSVAGGGDEDKEHVGHWAITITLHHPKWSHSYSPPN